jgi:hypothetical protein
MAADNQCTEGPPPVKPKVVDLREQFGSQYRLGHDPAYHAERGDNPRGDDLWLLVVLCEHGPIYPQGGTVLVASTHRRGSVATRLSELSCVRIVRDGADGVDVSFDLEDVDVVLAIMKPRRRRRLCEARKAALIDAGQPHQFPRSESGPPAGPRSYEVPWQQQPPPVAPGDASTGADH